MKKPENRELSSGFTCISSTFLADNTQQISCFSIYGSVRFLCVLFFFFFRAAFNGYISSFSILFIFLLIAENFTNLDDLGLNHSQLFRKHFQSVIPYWPLNPLCLLV